MSPTVSTLGFMCHAYVIFGKLLQQTGGHGCNSHVLSRIQTSKHYMASPGFYIISASSGIFPRIKNNVSLRIGDSLSYLYHFYKSYII